MTDNKIKKLHAHLSQILASGFFEGCEEPTYAEAVCIQDVGQEVHSWISTLSRYLPPEDPESKVSKVSRGIGGPNPEWFDCGEVVIEKVTFKAVGIYRGEDSSNLEWVPRFHAHFSEDILARGIATQMYVAPWLAKDKGWAA